MDTYAFHFITIINRYHGKLSLARPCRKCSLFLLRTERLAFICIPRPETGRYRYNSGRQTADTVTIPARLGSMATSHICMFLTCSCIILPCACLCVCAYPVYAQPLSRDRRGCIQMTHITGMSGIADFTPDFLNYFMLATTKSNLIT